jgi:hypothetical protein
MFLTGGGGGCADRTEIVGGSCLDATGGGSCFAAIGGGSFLGATGGGREAGLGGGCILAREKAGGATLGFTAAGGAALDKVRGRSGGASASTRAGGTGISRSAPAFPPSDIPVCLSFGIPPANNPPIPATGPSAALDDGGDRPAGTGPEDDLLTAFAIK